LLPPKVVLATDEPDRTIKDIPVQARLAGHAVVLVGLLEKNAQGCSMHNRYDFLLMAILLFAEDAPDAQVRSASRELIKQIEHRQEPKD